MDEQPNPGSYEAHALGCTCATMDNAHGKGYHWYPGKPDPQAFVITVGCPMHRPEPREAGKPTLRNQRKVGKP